ncbi:MAG: phytanoyl-CoA dioxygenase family protein [bacterium]
MNISSLTQSQIEKFRLDGYLRLPQVADLADVARLQWLAAQQLKLRADPLELEADVQYPGSPKNQEVEGGDTIRRLRQAYQRDPQLASWAANPVVTAAVRELLGGTQLLLTQAHHNCIMTKHPGYSSQTQWHRDCRYWNFNDCNLVSAWLALGHEQRDNGGLLVIPGSHRMDLRADQFGEATFFREDLSENQALLSNEVAVELNPGDVLLFHAQLLHAAGENNRAECKMALVFTYHNEEVVPVAGTRSSETEEIVIG